MNKAENKQTYITNIYEQTFDDDDDELEWTTLDAINLFNAIIFLWH